MNKKKIFSFITSAVMAAGFLSVMPQTDIFEPMTAEALKYDDYLSYTTEDKNNDGTFDSVTITKCDLEADNVNIPS